MLAKLIKLFFFIKLVEHNRKMFLVMAQAARFLPGFDNKIVVRLFIATQFFQ